MLDLLIPFICATLISFVLIPIVKKIGDRLNIIAVINNRTVHEGRIVRIGGLAIFTSFMICSAIFLKADLQINAIMIGAFVIFMMGLVDDIHDLRPRYKLLLQIVAATIVIFFGKVQLHGIHVPFFSIQFDYFVSLIVTYGWIIGITNAINIIDGLDGLCAGICIISLFTIGLISLTFIRTDIASLCLLLAGSITGFLYYNYHPASIFMGDCGSQFIGFLISVISLLGFGYKSSLFLSLGAPIVVLMIPIMDTLIAIIRRKLAHQPFSQADRGHMHHQLMFGMKFDVRKSVMILHLATLLFSMTAYIYLYNKTVAICLFLALMLCLEIFIEMTSMVSIHYKPILSTVNLIMHNDQLPSYTKGENSTKSLIMRNLRGEFKENKEEEIVEDRNGQEE